MAISKKQRIPLGKLAANAHRRGDLAEAERCYRILLKEHADNAELLASLGQVCLDQGKYDDAIEFLSRAVKHEPESTAKATYNLGLAYQRQYKYSEAVPFYEKALELDPTLTAALNNLAAIYHEQARYTDTVRLLEQALTIKSDAANIIGNLGLLYSETGRVKEALARLREAIRLDPALNIAHSNLLFNLHYLSENSPEAIFEAHRGWARQYAPPLAGKRLPHGNSRDPKRRLRIGYLSADFRLHSVAYFAVPIIKSHNRDDFEVYCYSDVKRPDDLTEHFRKLSDHWRDVSQLSDDDLAGQIRQDGIDILVDLAGHTSENRLLVFARKPAPVQVTYLGYPNTTGLDEIDYRLTDAWADPPGALEHLHSEELVRLPSSFLCYQPPTNTPDSSPDLPASKNGYVTFCSFNTLQKVTDEVIATWAEVLKWVPNSRLVMKAKGLSDPGTHERLAETFRRNGVDPDRVTLYSSLPNVLNHLDVYNSVDIALDTFPYNGTTTTVEALWMGVPVISLIGSAHVSRVGVSLLNNIGLPELLAESKENYIEQAVQLATDLPRLERYRKELRHRLMGSPLMDSAAFTQALEQRYREMWRKYCGESFPEVAVSPPIDSPVKAATPTVQPETDAKQVEIQFADETRIYAPAEIDNRETFSLLEYYDWYPTDAALIRRIIRPGQTILDVTQGNGLFGVLAAQATGPNGKVWSTTHGAPAACLEKTAAENGLAQLHILPGHGERQDLERLLIANDIHDLDVIRFESIDSMNAELKNCSHLLSSSKPMVVISPPSSIKNEDLTHLLDLSYTALYPVPALGALAPFSFASGEQSCASLYFCQPRHIETLLTEGLIVPEEESQPSDHYQVEGPWLEYLAALPYATPFVRQWMATDTGSPGYTEYQNALALYASAQNPAHTLSERYGRLLAAFETLVAVLNVAPSLPRLMTAARIASDLGFRAAARDTLSVLIDLFASDQPLNLNEAFLPPHSRYDILEPKDPVGGWCLAAILEQHEQVRATSAYYSDQHDFERLSFFSELGYASPEMERKRQLLELKLNKLGKPEHSPVIEAGSKPKPTSSTAKPRIAILYHLARTGGTLISKCLGCIEGNILLSEIHPLISVKSPLAQAKDWFGLLTEDEITRFQQRQPRDYSDIIELISSKCEARAQNLIIRDWSHIDFTGVPFVDAPSYRLSQTEVLKDRFEIHQIATVRHPLDSYLSVSRLAVMNGKLDLDRYMKGYREFATKAHEIGFIRYEDFCADPTARLKEICDLLEVNYSDSFLSDFSTYTRITGEVTSQRSTDEIRLPQRRSIPPQLQRALDSNADYWATLELLGYCDNQPDR